LLLYTVKEKGGKPERKPYTLPYGLINPYRNLKYENSEDYAQKPQLNCMFMNSASVLKRASREIFLTFQVFGNGSRENFVETAPFKHSHHFSPS
jgi:hypothetical protein